jgi:predicted MFS family arabinose efflux permease
VGPRKARLAFAAVQTAGFALLLPFGASLWLLTIPILVASVVGPAIDVTSRMTFLSREPALRTRLTTVYIVMMFVGGSIGSIAGTALFDAFGWTGIALYVFASCLCLTITAALGYRLYGERDRARVRHEQR